MRNTVVGFVAGIIAGHLLVSAASADTESFREQQFARTMERIAVALERTESAQRDEVQAQRDVARAVRDAAGRCK